MKELIELHEKILALPEEQQVYGLIWFGDSSTWRHWGDEGLVVELWPEDLQAEFYALNGAIMALMAEGFSFEAFAGNNEEGNICPRFRLYHQEGGKSSDSHRGDFVPEHSLIEQLRELSWEEQSAKAIALEQNVEAVVNVLEQLSKPTIRAEVSSLVPHKKTGYLLQQFSQAARDDMNRIHVLYREDLQARPDVDTRIQPTYREEGELQTMVSFNTLDEFREILPSLVVGSENIIWVLAWGAGISSYFLDWMERYGRQTAEIAHQPSIG